MIIYNTFEMNEDDPDMESIQRKIKNMRFEKGIHVSERNYMPQFRKKRPV